MSLGSIVTVSANKFSEDIKHMNNKKLYFLETNVIKSINLEE